MKEIVVCDVYGCVVSTVLILVYVNPILPIIPQLNNSDHSLICVDMELSETNKSSRGFWKFNNDLLTDKVYIDLIKSTLEELKNTDMVDKNQLWEFIKCLIRTVTMDFSIQR